MKGTNIPISLITVMVGVFLIFTAVLPIINNGLYGTLYENQETTNSSIITSLYTNYTTSCYPINTDTQWLSVINKTGNQDYTSEISIIDENNGVIKWTNSTPFGSISPTFLIDYRCVDSAYITDDNSRRIINYMPIMVLIIIIIALASLIYLR
jgi:hypothetical protein